MEKKFVIIIGGGLGGLALACMLGKKGYHVTILEKNDTVGYRDWETDRKSTRLNSSHEIPSRMPSSA